MRRRTVREVVMTGLAFSGLQAPSRRHGITPGLGGLILVGKKQFAPSLAQMPFDMIGEQNNRGQTTNTDQCAK